MRIDLIYATGIKCLDYILYQLKAVPLGMLTRMLFFVLLFPLAVLAQLTDDFGDGNLTENPGWSGTDSLFVITADGWLQSNGPVSSSVLYLSSSYTLTTETEWRCQIRLAFNPSSTNFCRVYLTSNHPDPQQAGEACYVQIGQSGAAPDSIKVFHKIGGQEICVLTGVTGCCAHPSENRIRLRLQRQAGGQCLLEADCNGGEQWISQGQFTLPVSIGGSWFSWVCDYNTANRYNQYFLDDIYVGVPVADTLAPRLIAAEWTDSIRLRLQFNEAVVMDTGSAENYFSFFPDTIDFSLSSTDYRQWEIRRAVPITSGTTDSLWCSGIRDIAGNSLSDTLLAISYYRPQPGDVILQEILADPIPSYGLPQTEYVELYNRTAFPVSLRGWQFRDVSLTAILPDITIPPLGYLVLCALDSAATFTTDIPVVGLSSMPSLNNDGEVLQLFNANGQLIHQQEYALSWHVDQTARDGGYSLEMRDREQYCAGRENWGSSLHITGGTPGSANSIAGIVVNRKPPLLVQTQWIAPDYVLAEFDEGINRRDGQEIYVVSGEGTPAVTGYAFPDSFPRGLGLQLAAAADSFRSHQIELRGISDCSGAEKEEGYTLVFGNAQRPQQGDIQLHEILSNPQTDGVDFIEVRNISDKILDMSGCLLMEKEIAALPVVTEYVRLPERALLLLPGGYMAFTENKEWLKENYSCGEEAAIVEVSGLPNWPDEEGIVALGNRQLETIDSVAYTADWFGPFLMETEGYSLERVSNDNIWHGASYLCRASPGRANSQEQDEPESAGRLSLSADIFSPDNDGYEDLLTIVYQLPDAGYMIRIGIWNEWGVKVATLVHNESGGRAGRLYWDGRQQDGQAAGIGLYILLAEWFNATGDRGSQKKIVAIARR
jgi:hypothetical protein